MIRLALAAAFLLAPPQENERPLFDFEESGSFTELVRKLEKAAKCKIRLAPDIEAKDVRVSLKKVGFYEAFDALCRAHGKVEYFLPKRMAVTDEVTLASGEWVEYPSSYHEHFKVVISSMTRTRAGSIEGSGAWVTMSMALLAPPWIRVTHRAGARVEWHVEEVLDKEGRSLIPREEDDDGFSSMRPLMGAFAQHGNVSDRRVGLKDFDIREKLKSVAGKIDVTSRGAKTVRVGLEIGAKVEVPGGSLTVDSLTEMGRHGRGNQWRVGVTFTPNEGEPHSLRDVLESEARFEGDYDWNPTFPKWNGGSVELDSFGLAKKPTWMTLRFRTGEQNSKVEFRFKDVDFKKEF